MLVKLVWAYNFLPPCTSAQNTVGTPHLSCTVRVACQAKLLPHVHCFTKTGACDHRLPAYLSLPSRFVCSLSVALRLSESAYEDACVGVCLFALSSAFILEATAPHDFQKADDNFQHRLCNVCQLPVLFELSRN